MTSLERQVTALISVWCSFLGYWYVAVEHNTGGWFFLFQACVLLTASIAAPWARENVAEEYCDCADCVAEFLISINEDDAI